MRRKVSINRLAANDLARISRTIGRTVSDRSAMKWEREVQTVLDLETNADSWPKADEETELDLRCRLYGRRRHVYRILYTSVYH